MKFSRTDAIVNRLKRMVAALAILGGLLWIVYAILGILQPLGNVATNSAAFWAAGAAGGAALVLQGLAVVGVALRYGLPGEEPPRFGTVIPSRYGVAMGWIGALAGLLAIATALLSLELPNNAMQLFGAVLTPLGAMLVAVEANGSEQAYRIAGPLFLVGALGMVGLLAQALLPVASWMAPVYVALAMAVYGFAWVRLGSLLATTFAEV
ncbi:MULTISPECIES: hypothetical protein [Caldilinea]|jgi:hypothetical protein|nr:MULTISPECIES: hypothetical protein [Caldilinea]GIV74026.1 MAG: hypothetical protein KatS3mg049_2582 [Caldilinea sp.]